MPPLQTQSKKDSYIKTLSQVTLLHSLIIIWTAINCRETPLAIPTQALTEGFFYSLEPYNCNSMISNWWLFLTRIFPVLPTSNASPRFSNPSSETYLTSVAVLPFWPHHLSSGDGVSILSPSCQCCSALEGLKLYALLYCVTPWPRACRSSLFPEGAVYYWSLLPTVLEFTLAISRQALLPKESSASSCSHHILPNSISIPCLGPSPMQWFPNCCTCLIFKLGCSQEISFLLALK